MRTIALYMPGEREIDLLSLVRDRDDVSVRCVVDPTGIATGTLVAEVLGLPVHLSFKAARLDPADRLVGPAAVLDEARRAAGRDGHEVDLVDTASFLATLDRPAPAAVEPEPAAAPPQPAVPAAARLDEPVRPVPPPATDIDEIDRTLARIDDVLERDRLLSWLMSLAMEAVGADGGSLMLRDPNGDELFIAVARGLSDAVLRRTRVAVGSGIAGRVAESGRAELVLSRPGDKPRERGPLSSALCVPLTGGDEVLGVLNLSLTAGVEPFGDAHLARAEEISERIGRILQRFEGVSRTREGELRQLIARHLMTFSDDADDLAAALAGWSGALTMDLGAESASLAVLRDDGTLLLAEGDALGETRTGTILQSHPAWDDVIRTGRPVVARQATADGDDELSLFFLPVGRPHLGAVLGMTFTSSEEAHRFQGRSAAVVDLLERRLPPLLRRFRRRDQLRRQNDLLTHLADRTTDPERGDRTIRLTALRVAAARIVGARRTYLVHGGEVLDGSSATPEGWDHDAWHRRVRELLSSAGDGHWLQTSLDPGRTDDPDATLLVAPSPHTPGTGLVMVGKDRHHPGDSLVFTPFDATLAVRLSSILPGAATDGAAPPSPERSEPTAPAAERGDELERLLRREMDRADRYHVAFSLSAFRLPADQGLSPDLVAVAMEKLRHLVRSSDTVSLMPDGVTLVLAPEETNAVSHLEHRVIEVLRDTLERPDLNVDHGRALYPGPFQTPAQLLGHALEALDNT